MADEYPVHLPAGSVLRQDLGLLGHPGRGGSGDALQEAVEARTDLLVMPLQPPVQSLVRRH